METKFDKSAPWIGFARKIYMLFSQDPEIDVVYDPENPGMKLFVRNETKATALDSILPTEKDFGNNKFTITIIPSNIDNKPIDIVRKAFSGNPVVASIDESTDPMAMQVCYLGFVNEIAQYFDDELDDPFGVESILYEDIARDVFDISGVMYYTDYSDEGYVVWPN